MKQAAFDDGELVALELAAPVEFPIYPLPFQYRTPEALAPTKRVLLLTL